MTGAGEGGGRGASSAGGGPEGVRPEPGRLAYLALLATTMIGTLSGNVINAPLAAIRADFGVAEDKAVLAVAAFTLAMVVFVPLAGWLCDRFGSIRVLLVGIVLMVLAQGLAVFSVNLEMLVALRVAQGAACSTFPPGVQRALVDLFPSKGPAALAAWASAIGVGQAIGPPLGGFVSDLVGWRGVFVVQAVFCAVVALVVLTQVPRGPGRPTPVHRAGMLALMLAMGGASVFVTLVGQRAGLTWEIVSGVVAAACMVAFLLLSVRHPESLPTPRSLLEKRFLRATVGAWAPMLVMGVTLVSLPLYLAEIVGLSSGWVGLVMFTMALAMAASGRMNATFGRRYSLRVEAEAGLLVLGAAALVLGFWTRAGFRRFEAGGGEVLLSTGGAGAGGAGGFGVGAGSGGVAGDVVLQIAGIVVLLALMGSALNAAQSTAAYSISRSETARNPMAFGIHNTSRFLGMAIGYAWAALVYPTGGFVLLFVGAALVALFAWAVVLIGGPLED
ncbi:MFS transporter [Brevibacterium litoralis]|uniref:MFS transporter n=1 Tax=Brevibacterium litoralis TaxID=3138935 RepID=UPI0032EE2062